MESMVTRKDIELPCKKEIRTTRALFVRVDGDKSGFERRNVLFYAFGGLCSLIHFNLERIDLGGISFQGVRNFFLEIIDDNEIREERQNIFDFEQICILKELHSSNIMRTQKMQKVRQRTI